MLVGEGDTIRGTNMYSPSRWDINNTQQPQQIKVLSMSPLFLIR
jgi:hypothetical protein